MLLGKRSRKAIAATLLTILFTDTFAPGVSYALTSGPTQPEATSFEPVDTTDMVNLQSGDLAYNIPLLEVPGPEGGYPLSLSYHAGIQTNEDASWVGLGWTVNPGAINRSVNGYPDDWYTPSTTRRDFWQGGSTQTYTVGVSFGIARLPATVNFGLSFSQDTYRGFGVGVDAGVGIKLGKNSPLNLDLGVGVTPYGEPYATAELGVRDKIGNFTGSFGITAQTNFSSLDVGFKSSIGYTLDQNAHHQSLSASLLGAKMSTGADKPSYSIGGLTSSISNANAGKISTTSEGWHVDIPVWYGVNASFGYSKTKYFSDESATTLTHGSLWPNGWGGTGNQWGGIADGAAYDQYALLEDPAYKNIIDYPDPTTLQGGAVPDYDVYNVNAQGLGGNMRPYLFQGGIVNQNINSGSTPVVTYCSPGVTDAQPYYRFDNDFSNSYRQNNASFYTDASLNLRLVTPPMDGAPAYGNNDGNTGYGGGNALAGSRYVNTTLQIKPRNALGYNKSDRLFDSHMIEGYSITNESGVTYHFGLPAYSYNEENYQEKIDKSSLTFTRLTKSSPYAYTWYLTTITGPDYVDRNNDGIADDGDWGYWVDFEYGKWTNAYNWRNPSEGFQRDEDNQFHNCSMGTKEVYYLNAIRTRSHLALFEKDVRTDGKGASINQFNKNGGNQDYASTSSFDNTSASSLQLSRIYLLNASDESFVTAGSDPYGYIYKQFSDYNGCTSCALPANVLDSKDVDAAGRANLEAKAIRIIDFNYDYSRCQNTSNSFAYDPVTGANQGKLTLNSLVTRGKGGATIMPPTQFAYDLSGADLNTTAGVTLTPTSFSTTNGTFQPGDMINAVASQGGTDFYCGVITSSTVSSGTYTYTLANSSYTGSTLTKTVYKTKNPPYNKDAYDVWGMYKSDYNLTQIGNNENLGRTTSVASSRGADAWSLRTVTSCLGSTLKIGYESDSYSSSVLSNGYSFVATNIQQVSGHTDQLQIDFGDVNNGLNTYFNTGDKVSMLMLLRILQSNSVLAYTNPCGWQSQNFNDQVYDTRQSANPTTILTVSNSTMIVQNPDFSTFYQTPVQVTYQDGSSISTTCAKNKQPVACNLRASSAIVTPGGGLRVNRIDLVEPVTNITNSTLYNYDQATTPGVSSGVTSYEPWVFEMVNILVNNSNDANGVKLYKSTLYQGINSVLAISREAPTPGVMYGNVTVTSQVQNPDETSARDVPGATQYQFEVYRPNMVGRVDVATSSPYTTGTGRTSTSTSWGTMMTHTLALMKFTGQLGMLKRVIQFDKKDPTTRKKVSETINHYLDEGLENLSLANFMTQYKTRLGQKYNYQGYLQERLSEVKVVNEQGWTPASQVMSTLSTRETYPSIETGQTVINYVNGSQTDSYNTGFDYYSGAITQSIETDAYGNDIMTQVVPAYTKYSAMGLKVNTGSNLNMLTQTAETYTYKVDGITASSNKLGLITATANTWSNGISSLGIDGTSHIQDGRSEQSGSNYYPNGNVWRPQATYNWLPTGQTSDGLTPMGSFPTTADFNWTNPGASDSRWVKTSGITQYDVYSKSLEETDILNNYSATHMNYGESKVALTGGPANYYEIAYSGAEDAGLNQTNPGFIQAGAGTATSAAAHTGAKSLLLNAGGAKGFVYSINTNNLVAGRNYMAGVWVKPVSGTASDVKLYYDINGGTPKANSMSSGSVTAKAAGGWYLINLLIKGTDITAGNTLNVWCRNDHASVNAYVDDMRFQPLNASTTAYVYDPFSGELTHILDNNNLYTRYEYDVAGKLVRTYKEKIGLGEFKTGEYVYNYGSTLYSSDAIANQYYTRTTCSPTQVPNTVQISVAAGAFTSYISKADANRKAQVYAQDQANMQGTCTQMAVINLVRQTSVTGSMSVAFLQNGTTVRTVAFPASGANPTTILLLPGAYTMQFSWGGGAANISYDLEPGSQQWSGGNVTSTSVTFTTGVNYTLTGSDRGF